MSISTVTDTTDLFVDVFYVIDMSLIQPVFDIAPQAKVERIRFGDLTRSSSGTSTSNPGIPKCAIKISSDLSKGFVKWGASHCQVLPPLKDPGDNPSIPTQRAG